ncbi:hypothetical protein [Allokutzneria oryzae]|uniref:Uncharacterized protein n=1 Tax=Allokutzneria oryzae TaxID=1378989 RepID=A0ABV5ZQ23_9PSEU
MNSISRIGVVGAALAAVAAGVAAPGIAEASADACKNSISLASLTASNSGKRLSVTANWNQCWSGTTYIQFWVSRGDDNVGGDHLGPGNVKAGRHSKKVNFDGNCKPGTYHVWVGLYKNNTDLGTPKAEATSNKIKLTC